MKLEQKVFELCSETGLPLRNIDKLQLVINDVITGYDIRNYFASISIRESSLLGYSHFQSFQVTGKDEKYPLSLRNGSLNVHIYNKDKGHIYFKKIRKPIVQLNDIEAKNTLSDFISALNEQFLYTEQNNPNKEVIEEQPITEEDIEKFDELAYDSKSELPDEDDNLQKETTDTSMFSTKDENEHIKQLKEEVDLLKEEIKKINELLKQENKNKAEIIEEAETEIKKELEEVEEISTDLEEIDEAEKLQNEINEI
jgi:hypothetical protein